ncbi:hypothetical protein MMC29_001376 [Sticta canariensis]|nr:hypothetical protein [Sticta canariensis]
MLKLFEETSGFSLGSLAQVDKFLPEPMPLESHKTVIDYAKFIKETWGKDKVTIRIPLPKTLSTLFKDLQRFELRIEDVERKLVESRAEIQKLKTLKGVEIKGLKDSANKAKIAQKTREVENQSTISNLMAENQSIISNLMEKFDTREAENRSNISNLMVENQSTISSLMEKFNAMHTNMNGQVQIVTEDSIARNDVQFRMCRGNLLMDLIKKLLPKEAKKSGHRPNSTRWTTMAENYAEADFKKATQNFNVCNDSAQMMQVFQSFGTFVRERNEAAHDSQVEMARLLTSSPYREKPDNQFWCHLFEYVYERTVEEAAQR